MRDNAWSVGTTRARMIADRDWVDGDGCLDGDGWVGWLDRVLFAWRFGVDMA